MIKRLILRGMLAGGVAGIITFIFARVFGEPQINAAIAYGSARDSVITQLNAAAHLPSLAPGPDIFSRTIQSNVGASIGIIVFGIAMGMLVSVVYIVCLGRIGNVRPRPAALLVAAGGFLSLYLVPYIKYPANPPSIGHEETIHARGVIYLAMVGCSLGVLILAVMLGQRLKVRLGIWSASLVAGGVFVVAVGVVMALLPQLGHLAYNRQAYGLHATETPLPLKDAKGNIVFPGFPADTLFNFRIYSVAAQLLLWSTIGIVFAPLAERIINPFRARIHTEKAAALV